MGGSGSEEFMVESEIGDNTLILCPTCGYAANDEKASCAPDTPLGAEGKPQTPTPEKAAPIDTPDVRTIEELSAFLRTTPQSFIKTLIYRALNSELPGIKSPEGFVAVCIRGDLEVNEVKLASCLKASEVELASNTDVERITGAPVGFAGPVGFSGAPVVADSTVMAMHDAVTGALKKDLHFIHVEPGRDFSPLGVFDLRTVKAGDTCPVCGAEFYSKKGNELGHIFKLGDKYTKSMGVFYLDEKGEQKVPLMGCYGIGLDRTLASVIEEHHDGRGIIWPMGVAPFHAVIVPVQYDGAMGAAADTLYGELTRAGVEVLLDDRNERPGVKFNDMDLLGIPIRIVVGAKNLPRVEIKKRAEETVSLVPLEEAAAFTARMVRESLRDAPGT
jgi:prolyl-tRNA synthetase